MPTGYTANLMDKGQTFKEFILNCARAFGACLTMRDDSYDKPIPEKFKPSDWHIKELKKAQEELKKLKAMNEKEKMIFGKHEKESSIKQKEEWLKKEQSQNERLEEMEKQVKAWRPPTKDHQGLKDFMLQQIGVSKNNLSYIQEEIEKAKSMPPLAYYIHAVSSKKRDVDYHIEENEKEIERVNQRNEWLKQLRNSI